MTLCLSTLTCPTWTLPQIVTHCVANGITGLDFRGIGPQVDITLLPEFSSRLDQTLTMLKQHGLSMPCLNTSVTLVTPDAGKWAAMRAEAQRSIALAVCAGTHFLRVFGGEIPNGMSRPEAATLGQRHLTELVDLCAGSGCIPLLETHDDWAPAERVLQLIGPFNPNDAAVLWDLEHPWKQGEKAIDTATGLRPYIRHVHVKDLVKIDGVDHPGVIGRGVLPLGELFAALRAISYNGWLCLESEKRWDPLSPEPEENLPAFAAFCRRQPPLY